MSDLNDALNIAEARAAIKRPAPSKPTPIAMMRVAIVAAMTVLFSCVMALAEPPPFSLSDHPSQDGRCIGDTGVGDLDRSERACLEQVGELARRIGPGLQLKFRSGLTRVYVDEDAKCQSDTAEGCIRFKLTGYFPKHDLMLIQVGYWEGVSWLLVRADTGAASEIVSPPHYSPDQRWLASVASGLGPSGPPDGMDLVPATSDPSLKEWHYRTPDDDQWLYEFAGWDGDSRVRLSATSLGAPERHVQTSIERRDGSWHLEVPK